MATKTKKSPKTTPTVPSSNGTTQELREPQRKILEALARADRPLTKSQLAEIAQADVSKMQRYVGSLDPILTLKKENQTGFPALVTLGYVQLTKQSRPKGVAVALVEITAKGKQALRTGKVKAASSNGKK